MSLVISVDEPEELALVALAGELDMNSAPQLHSTVSALIEGGRSRVVLDLSGLTFCDSAGLSMLARVNRRIGELHGTLILARPERIVRSVLDLSGMAQLIPVFDTVEAATVAARG